MHYHKRQQHVQCQTTLSAQKWSDSELVMSTFSGKLVPLAWFPFNPFTAPACTISGLKDARTRLQKFYIPTYMLHNTSTFSVMRHDENLFTCQCKKEDKKAYCFKFRTFMCCFQMIPWQ